MRKHLLVLPLLGLLPGPALPAPDEAAGRAGSREAAGSSQEAAGSPGLPWKPGVEYRYLWIRDGRKAGETRFGLEEHVKDDPYYVLTATRTYDWDGSSQRARSTTTVRRNGQPIAFDEALEMSGLKNLKAHQVTEVRFQEGKARVKYVLNGKEDATRRHEFEVPAEAFLYGNQAVEHWALFAAKLPRTEGRHVLKLFYPDHARVLAVSFERSGEEKLKLGTDDASAVRFRFECPEVKLKGSIWLDPEGRLLQVEFAGADDKSPVLRVVLEKKP